MSRRCIALARVSTEDQFREGVSIDAQCERLRAYAVAQGLGEVDVRVEAKSAKILAKRPVLLQILEEVRAGEVAAVLVFKLDRLARNTVEALELARVLKQHDCRLISLSETIDTGSAFGQFFYTVLAALAQMERDQLAERTRMALQHKKNQGAKLGGAPTGWKKVAGPDGKLTALEYDKEGQAIVRRIRLLRESGCTYQVIVTMLMEAGILTPRGSARWNVGTLHKMLRRGEYACASTVLPESRCLE
jgi:site-specific DNA recombinase